MTSPNQNKVTLVSGIIIGVLALLLIINSFRPQAAQLQGKNLEITASIEKIIYTTIKSRPILRK